METSDEPFNNPRKPHGRKIRTNKQVNDPKNVKGGEQNTNQDVPVMRTGSQNNYPASIDPTTTVGGHTEDPSLIDDPSLSS